MATATVESRCCSLRCLATCVVTEDTSAPESSSALTGMDFPVGPVAKVL